VLRRPFEPARITGNGEQIFTSPVSASIKSWPFGIFRCSGWVYLWCKNSLCPWQEKNYDVRARDINPQIPIEVAPRIGKRLEYFLGVLRHSLAYAGFDARRGCAYSCGRSTGFWSTIP
jgi:hypothetical protein